MLGLRPSIGCSIAKGCRATLEKRMGKGRGVREVLVAVVVVTAVALETVVAVEEEKVVVVVVVVKSAALVAALAVAWFCR